MKNLLSKFEQPTQDFILRLRNKQNVTLFDRKTKLFHHFQLNKSTKFICWQRHITADKQNWKEHNSCLSLSEVLDIRAEIGVHCQEMCFK